jgi:hypothetical protein
MQSHSAFNDASAMLRVEYVELSGVQVLANAFF